MINLGMRYVPIQCKRSICSEWCLSQSEEDEEASETESDLEDEDQDQDEDQEGEGKDGIEIPISPIRSPERSPPNSPILSPTRSLRSSRHIEFDEMSMSNMSVATGTAMSSKSRKAPPKRARVNMKVPKNEDEWFFHDRESLLAQRKALEEEKADLLQHRQYVITKLARVSRECANERARVYIV